MWRRELKANLTQGNFYKFTQHSNLKSKLLATANHVLIDVAKEDNMLGLGLQAINTSIDEWTGLNLLGFSLMETREYCSMLIR